MVGDTEPKVAPTPAGVRVSSASQPRTSPPEVIVGAGAWKTVSGAGAGAGASGRGCTWSVQASPSHHRSIAGSWGWGWGYQPGAGLDTRCLPERFGLSLGIVAPEPR